MSAPIGNVLPSGTVELEFKGIRLHGYTTDLSDDIQWRVAVHEFDRRDGAQTENMGRAPWQCRITLVFVGTDAFLDAQALILALEINPSGLFVHPIYGSRQATCSGTQGAKLTANEANTYTLPVTFIENILDASVIGEQSQGVAAKAQAVTAQAAVVSQYVSSTQNPSIPAVNPLLVAALIPGAASQVNALATAATAFAANATTSAATGAVDSSLLLSLNAMPTQTAVAIAALRAASTMPEVTDAVMSCEVLLALCSAAGDALLAQRPPLGGWTVPGDMTLMAIAEQFYGGDAMARIGAIEADNPNILGLVLIPAGTSLKLAPATV